MSEAEAVQLPRRQELHWTIHRTFSVRQQISEQRRHLAGDIGELTARFVSELMAAGWAEE